MTKPDLNDLLEAFEDLTDANFHKEATIIDNTINYLYPQAVRSTIDIDGFIIWTGGDRPVDKDSLVAVKIQGGMPRVPVKASEWPQICWQHRTSDDPKSIYNIIAYKVL